VGGKSRTWYIPSNALPPPCFWKLSHGAICHPTSFWKRLSRLMSKVNPEPNVIHIMGCYILGNPNGEKVGTREVRVGRGGPKRALRPLEGPKQGGWVMPLTPDSWPYPS
jgi:hypothetical protein